MNESMTAMSINYETIDVFCDWREAEADRVKLKENAFYSMWNNVEPSLKVLEFPNISDVLIEKYRRKDPNFDIQTMLRVTQVGLLDHMLHCGYYKILVEHRQIKGLRYIILFIKRKAILQCIRF